MEFKDYYATLGVGLAATRDDIKRAYRKLARRYHPDVSHEPNAEARFKDLAEAHEALIDPERRAAYDEIVHRHAAGQPYDPPPGWDRGVDPWRQGSGDETPRQPRGHAGGADEAGDFSDFFESLFGHGGKGGARGQRRTAARGPLQGQDHHAHMTIGLEDAFHGGKRTISLGMPVAGQAALQERQLEVSVPPGVREGQQLRLAGQGAAGHGGAPAGDLYLEVRFSPHPVFRLVGGDLYLDLPVSPWEAALGAVVPAPTLSGEVQLTVPAGSSAGRRLRLKGRGMPGRPPGDFYVVLTIALPPSTTEPEQDAYNAFARAFAAFDPRAALQA